MARDFIWIQRDGSWSVPHTLALDITTAGQRMVKRAGPFSATRDGVLLWENEPRALALRKLQNALRTGNPGHSFRVRKGNGNVVFTTREIDPPPAVDPVRREMAANARWGIAHQGQIHYSQARPIDYHFENLPWSADCSGSTISYAKAAGAKDPSGNGYNRQGNTDSILAHSRSIERRELQLGDMVLWSFGTDGQHVAVVIQEGDDPLLASHGSEAGPVAVRLDAEDRFHASAQVHYLQLEV